MEPQGLGSLQLDPADHQVSRGEGKKVEEQVAKERNSAKDTLTGAGVRQGTRTWEKEDDGEEVTRTQEFGWSRQSAGAVPTPSTPVSSP